MNADQIVALVGLKNEREIRYFSFNPPIVKAATLGKLVDWLLSEKVQQDPLFLYAFFASHDVFASSVDVLDELSVRYERARSGEGQDENRPRVFIRSLWFFFCFSVFTGTKLQLRLHSVLMQWIKLRPMDFRLAPVKKRMEEFLSKVLLFGD